MIDFFFFFDKIFMIDLIFLFLYIFTRPLEFFFFFFLYDSCIHFCVYVCVCKIIGLVQYQKRIIPELIQPVLLPTS